jgi:hypothetical protein
VFNSSNLVLVVGPQPSTPAEDVSPLSVLQLDPSLHNVTIRYTSLAAVGKIVLAPHLSTDKTGQPTFGFTSLSLQVGDDAPFLLFDDAGVLHNPSTPSSPISPTNPPSDLARQLVLSFEAGQWSIGGLQRNEMDYPAL